MEYLIFASDSNERYEAMLTEFYDWKNDIRKQIEVAEVEMKKCQTGINGAKQNYDTATERIWTEEKQKQQLKIQHLTETLNGADKFLLSKKRLFFEQSFWNAWMILSGWASLPELPAYCQPLPETASLEDYFALPVFHYRQMFEEERKRYASSYTKENLAPKGEFQTTEQYEAQKAESAKEAAFRLVKQSHEKKAKELALYAQKSNFAKLLIKSFYAYPQALAELFGSYDADNQQFSLVWNGFFEQHETKIFVPDKFASEFKGSFVDSGVSFTVLDVDSVSGTAICYAEFKRLPFYFYLSQKKTALMHILENCQKYSLSQAEELKKELDSIKKNEMGMIVDAETYERFKKQLLVELRQIKESKVESNLSISTNEKNVAEKFALATILAEKLIAMTQNVQDALSSHMYETKQAHESKLQILQNSQQTNIDEFVENQKKICIDCFAKEANERKASHAVAVADVLPSYRNAVESQIDNFGTTDELLDFIENRLSSYCNQLGDSLIRDATSNIYDNIFSYYQKQIVDFQAIFEKYFKDVNLMGMTFEKGNSVAPAKPYISKANFSNVAQYVAGEIKKENQTIGGGMAASAAAGALLGPAGIFVGGLLGGIAGAAVGTDMNNVRANVKQRMTVPLDNYFRNIADQIVSSIDGYIAQLLELLKSEIDGCLLKYKNEVNQRIVAAEAAETVIQRSGEQFENDIVDISHKKEKIDIIQKQLKWIDKKEAEPNAYIIQELQLLKSEGFKNLVIESKILISMFEQLSNEMQEFDKYISHYLDFCLVQRTTSN